MGSTNEEKELGIQKGVEVKNWDPKSEKSPPKIEYKKKVIKNMKKWQTEVIDSLFLCFWWFEFKSY